MTLQTDLAKLQADIKAAQTAGQNWLTALGTALNDAAVVMADLEAAQTPPVVTTGGVTPPPAVPNGGFINAFATPLAASQVVDPTSATVVANLVKSIAASGYSFGVNCGTSGLTLAVAGSATPAVTVKAQGSHGDFTSQTGSAIPIPAGARPGGATGAASGDDPLVVYQPSTDTLWELWQAMPQTDGTWVATWGGKLTNASKSSGVFPAPYGLSGSGVAYGGLMVTEAEVAAGGIDHAVCCCFPSLTAPQVPPANRTDASAHPGQPAEGAWFRFPVTLAVPPGLTPFAQMIFRAIQTYGMVVADLGGAAMIQAEYSNVAPADPIGQAMAGQAEYSVIAGLPWGSLQLLSPPKNWPSWT